MTDDRVLTVAADLYGLGPGEFTAARNEAAGRLKESGERGLADRVKALRKPTAAAWVVNLLVRHRAEEMAQVLDLGASLRQAQADLDGDALRELARQRRRLIAAVAGDGRQLARDRGQRVSEAVLRQVQETLHAAMIDTDAEAAVRTGLLVDALSATGVGGLKVATAVADHTALGGGGAPPGAAGGRGGLSVVPDVGAQAAGPDPEEQRRKERRAARAEAKRAVDAAETAARSAGKEVASWERKVDDLQARTLQVNGEIDELRRRIDELEDRLDRLDDKAEAAREAREEAAATQAQAEQDLADARARLEDLADEG